MNGEPTPTVLCRGFEFRVLGRTMVSFLRNSLAILASWRFNVLVSAAILAAPASGAEPPAGGAPQQNQMMRQQQQEALQLRMLQEQRSLQSPPGGAQQRQERERLEIDQRQRQQERQYRHAIEPPTIRPGEDAGVERARSQRDLLDAREQGEAQLGRFDYELQQRTESKRTEKARGEVQRPEPSAPLQ